MRNKTALLRNIILSYLIAGSAYAGELKVTPSIEVGIIASDNVRPAINNKKGSFISKITPRLQMNYDASRAAFDLDINNAFINFSESSYESGDMLELSVNGYLDLIDDNLILIASSDISNRSRSSDEVSLDNLNPVDTVQIRQNTLGFTFNTLNSDFYIDSQFIGLKRDSDDNVNKKEGVNFEFSSGNGIGSKYILWINNVYFEDYKQERRDYRYVNGEIIVGGITNFYFNPFIRGYYENLTGNISSRTNNKMESIGAGFNVKVGNSIDFFLSYNEVTENTTINDNYISSLLKWRPSDRTYLEMAYGQRFFGDSYKFTFEQKLSRVETTITYNESVRAFDTYSYELNSKGYFLCPLDGYEVREDCVLSDDGNINLDDYNFVEFNEYVRIQNEEYALSKEAYWNSSIKLSGGELNLLASFIQEERIESGMINENKTLGVSFNRKVNELSSALFEVKYVDRKYDKDKINEHWHKTNYFLYKFTYARELNSTLTANFNLQYVDKESNRPEHNHEQSRIGFTINKEF